MRNELERSQQIDHYLDGKMDAEEKARFEKEMQQDTSLQNEVEAQRQLRESIFQGGIKKAAQKAFKKLKLYKKLFWGGAGVVVLAIAGIGFLFLNKDSLQSSADHSTDSETIVQQNLGENYKDPNKHLESQFYNVKNGSDTILETQNGMLVVLPNDGFVNASGEEVEGDITLEIKEAFDPASIMQSGLSTTSDGKMLETGGMFYIKAYQNGEELQVNPDDPMVVDIPTQQKDKNMMLFDGEVQEDGTINWTDPKKFENWLTPVDILSLNFYPPNYLSELEKLGQNSSDKEFTDSLYYSFEGACDEGQAYTPDTLGHVSARKSQKNPIIWTQNYSRNGNEVTLEFTANIENGWMLSSFAETDNLGPTPLVFHFDNNDYQTLGRIIFPSPSTSFNSNFGMDLSYFKNQVTFYQKIKVYENATIEVSVDYMVYNDNRALAPDTKNFTFYLENTAIDSIISEAPNTCGINPSKIKAIWQEKFNNTNLATNEFEKRIPTIHRSCENSVLDVYVNNLDQSLSYCDSLAATLATGEVKKKLKAFAQNGDGRVQMNNRQAKRLANYYQRKHKQYSKILKKTQEEFWEQQRKLDQEAMQKNTQKTFEDIQRQQKMFRQEFETNLDEAYRQLGYKRVRSSSGYVATVRSTGWKNVDKYVFESTVNRTTLNYTDPKTGKKAVIKYEQISLSVAKRDQFDEVFVYLIPKGLSSFNRADENESGFQYKLNELFQYDLMIVGMQEESIFTYRQETISARSYGILTLSKSSREQFNKMSGQYSWSSTRKDLQQDLDYYLFNRKDKQRQSRNQARKDLRNQLMSTVFPCNNFQTVAQVQTDDQFDGEYTVVSKLPKFPGGDNALKSYFNIDGSNLNQKIYVQFTVSKTGVATNPKILKGNSKYDKEILKRINNMPRWKPGEDNNGPIDVPYTYSIEI